jgi:hypothetical protein
MTLTENARLGLDGAITNYRSFLEGVEDVLARTIRSTHDEGRGNPPKNPRC